MGPGYATRKFEVLGNEYDTFSLLSICISTAGVLPHAIPRQLLSGGGSRDHGIFGQFDDPRRGDDIQLWRACHPDGVYERPES
jgi:hypothetical protein